MCSPKRYSRFFRSSKNILRNGNVIKFSFLKDRELINLDIFPARHCEERALVMTKQSREDRNQRDCHAAKKMAARNDETSNLLNP